MKKLFTLLAFAAVLTITGCKTASVFNEHSKVEFIAPKSISSPAELVFKIWGVKDMVSNLVPPNTKVGKFIEQTNKYCQFYVKQFPTHGNDTTALAVKCETDSITKAIAGLIGKKVQLE